MHIVLVYFFISWFSEICWETAAINSNMQKCYWNYILVCHPDEGYAQYKHHSFREVSKHNKLKAFLWYIMPNLVQVEGNVPYDRETLDVFTVKWIYVCM